MTRLVPVLFNFSDLKLKSGIRMAPFLSFKIKIKIGFNNFGAVVFLLSVIDSSSEDADVSSSDFYWVKLLT